MPLQWKMENTGAWYGFSGKLIAAWIVPVFHGENTGKWGWFAEIPSKYICAREGNCATLPLARRAANRAWRKFLAYAALKAE